MANIASCPHCGQGRMLELVCYDVCDNCGRPSTARLGCVRFQDLEDGDHLLAGYDPVITATILTKGTPPDYIPVDGEVEPNAYNRESGRFVCFGPYALVKRV
jgi:hypothetical protein